jgi:hypothetical protein
MDKVQKTSGSEYRIPWSEPFKAVSLVCKLKACHVIVARRPLNIGNCSHLNTKLLLLLSSKPQVHCKLQNNLLTSGMR